MKALVLLLAAFVVLAVPTTLIRLIGRRLRVPGRLVLLFLVAMWTTVFVGWALSQRAQPGLFPETSPCSRTDARPVSRYLPPDSFCLHADGELRTVNGAGAKAVFWTAANTTLAAAIAGAWARRRRPA